jgi:hypothetical protein
MGALFCPLASENLRISLRTGRQLGRPVVGPVLGEGQGKVAAFGGEPWFVRGGEDHFDVGVP